MLQSIRIQNIVLVESAEVPFGPGFNVITGETGAGKSAIMAALSLVAGARSDATLIRKGADKGIVEATFEASPTAAVWDLLHDAGVEGSQTDLIVIRREISASGRSRAFVNDQLISLVILSALGSYLLEMVGQHANQELLQLDQHRAIVDSYGSLGEEKRLFSSAWKQVQDLTAEREQLTKQESQRLRDLEICLQQSEELEEGNLEEGEEESLFAEYTLLTNAEDLTQGTESLLQAISADDSSALALLAREKSTFQQLVKLDPSLREAEESFQRAIVELHEVSHVLRQYQDRIDNNPQHLAKISDRLSAINKLKRKYGPSLSEVMAFQSQLKQRVAQLQGADARLEQLVSEISVAERKADQLAIALTKRRQKTAQALAKALVTQLASLNMSKVQLEIRVTPHARSVNGDDLVEIYFAPNVGERLLSLRDCASGGELARVMLALKALLSDKSSVGTLVFDEIDANVGGETARIVGQKLAEIGQSLQLLCISHFPQVARCAQHHIQISKVEQQGRTYTRVKRLDNVTREEELRRMMGGEVYA